MGTSVFQLNLDVNLCPLQTRIVCVFADQISKRTVLQLEIVLDHVSVQAVIQEHKHY